MKPHALPFTVLMAALLLLAAPTSPAEEGGYAFAAKYPADIPDGWYFQAPFGVALTPDGDLLVADTGSHKIGLYSSGGVFGREWGGFGVGNGQLNTPAGLTSGADGTIYVVDSSNHRVQRFNAEGVYLGQWGQFGMGNGDLNQPTGIALSPLGDVYVVDYDNNRVQVFDAEGTYLFQWGVIGTEEGQFVHPHSIAISLSGDVYVSDRDNHRIQKFTLEGAFVGMWGGFGSETVQDPPPNTPAPNGLFNNPLGLAVDAAGNVYVCDSGNNRVQKFDANGVFVSLWGATGSGDGQFSTPSGIAMAEDGTVYIADSGNKRIQKFTSPGVFEAAWSAASEADGRFKSPADVELNGDGDLFVSEFGNHRIQKLTYSGNFGIKWGTLGTVGDFLMNEPRGISLRPKAGNLYVADRRNHRIKVFSQEGAFVTEWGGVAGSGNGQMRLPASMAVNSTGNVYVADTNNNRIEIFNATGTYVNKFGAVGSGDGQLFNPQGIVIAADDTVYVADSRNNRIQHFSSTGTYLGKWGTLGAGEGQFDTPQGLALTPEGDLLVADTGNNRIQKFSPSGVFLFQWGGYGWNEGLFNAPTGVGVDENGWVYVADSNNHRIQVFEPTVAAVLSSVIASPTNVSTIPVTLHFGDSVSPFDESMLNVTNATVSNFAGADQDYTFDLEPITDGEVLVTIDKGVVLNASNWPNAAAEFSIVYDATPPVIELLGDAEVTVNCAAVYGDAGTTATDNIDGDLSGAVVVTGAVDTAIPGEYFLYYDVSDLTGNAADTVSRKVVVEDLAAPIITLNGVENLELACRDAYVELGATALDACEGDLTGQIQQTGTVDPNTAGVYTVEYAVEDGSGNVAETKVRTVTVLDDLPPELTLNGAAVHYVECQEPYIEPGFLAEDLCAGDITGKVLVGIRRLDIGEPGDYIIQYIVADPSGNFSQLLERTVRVVDTTPPVLSLLGDAAMTIECGTAYVEPGVGIFEECDTDIASSLTVDGEVDATVPGVYILTYNVSDASGNDAAPVQRTVTVEDTTPPVITLEAVSPLVMECGSEFEPGLLALDACEGDITGLVTVDGEVNPGVPGDYTITYNVTDGSGNAAVPVTLDVTVVDNTAPAILLAGSDTMTVECGDDFTEPGFETLDACDGDLTAQTVVEGEVDSRTPGEYTLTYTVTDTAENQTMVTRTVTVADTTAPAIVLNGPAVMPLPCGAPYIEAGATATDRCEGDLSGQVVITGLVDPATPGEYEITYQATDGAGNESVVITRTVTVTNSEPPVFSLDPPEVNPRVECGGTVPGVLAAMDLCEGDLTEMVETIGTVDTRSPGEYVVVHRVTDAAGNEAMPLVRLITVEDTRPPILAIIGEANMTIECGAEFTDPGPVALDTCEGYVTEKVTVTGTVNTGEPGVYTLTYNVSDLFGNASPPVVRTVTVRDTTAPLITLLGDETVFLTLGSEYTDAGALVDDVCDAAVAVVAEGEVDTDTPGLYTITYFAADNSGNEAAPVVRTIIVQAVCCPGEPEAILQEAGILLLEHFDALDTDGDGVLTLDEVEAGVTGIDSELFDALDLDLNGWLDREELEVAAAGPDVTPPVITLTGAAQITLECRTVFNDPGATALDDRSGDISGRIARTGAVNTSVPGEYPLVYTVSDDEGNPAEPVVRTVTVADTAQPVITLLGSPSPRVQAGQAYIDAGATAADHCAGDLTAQINTDGAVNTALPGVYPIVYTVSDTSGNAAAPVTRTVTVVDQSAPVITLNGAGEMTIECATPFTDPGATALDDVDGDITGLITVTGAVNAMQPGVYTLVYRVTDTSGNRAIQRTRQVTVADTTAPVLSLTGDAAMSISQFSAFTDPGATATDLCEGNLDARVAVDGRVNTDVAGEYTLTYLVSDGHGNMAEPVTRTVTVLDNQPPVIGLLGSTTITHECGSVFADPGASAADSNDGNLTGQIAVEGAVDGMTPGTYTLTYSVADAAGNEAVPAQRVVNVVDTKPPVLALNGPALVMLECGVPYLDEGVTAEDQCGGDLGAQVVVTGAVDTAATGSYTLVFSLSDAAGNPAVPVVRTVQVIEGPACRPDTPPNGAEALAALSAAFDQLDTNGDGVIDFSEARALLANLTPAVFAALDADSDGVLSRTELGLEEIEEGCRGCRGRKLNFTGGGMGGDWFMMLLSLLGLATMAAMRRK